MSEAATQYGKELVGLSGLEPPTSPLSGVRSNHLSYKPIKVFLLEFHQTICCGHCTVKYLEVRR